jgi:RNA polymerase sigma factor (TIGR02999 family)
LILARLDISTLLQAWSAGDRDAAEQLVSALYPELRRRAAARLRGERPGHTLQPTALVNEAYLRLAAQRRVAWKNREHFLAIAAQMMRRILVDHARRRKMVKRSGQWLRVSMHDDAAITESSDVDVLALDAALSRLAAFDPQKSRLVEMRYFSGMSVDETAAAMGVSPATIDREWRAARAWLQNELPHGS